MRKFYEQALEELDALMEEVNTLREGDEEQMNMPEGKITKEVKK
jgi:CHASE3 domain sensor protein